jgi:peptide/nickel transport system permease protein
MHGAIRLLLSSGSGKAGMILLLALLVASIYVALTFPANFGSQVWNNPAAWVDYPKAAPPAWIKLLDGKKSVEHTILKTSQASAILRGEGFQERVYSFTVDYQYERAPTFTSFTISNVTFHSEPPIIAVSVLRPDGRELVLYRHVVPGPRENEEAPFTRYRETPLRIYLTGDDQAILAVSDFYRNELGVELQRAGLQWSVDEAVFGVPVNSSALRVLNGIYRFNIKVVTYDPSDLIGSVSLVIGGSVFGAMGTDSLGRDLALGLLFGFPIALLIGVATAVLATLLGSITGIISGYVGGKTDTAIQRSADILNNIPLLPILLFLTFILGQRLWIVVLVLIAFSWPGLTVVIRSMVLQLKTSQLTEATRALGASPLRIMFRHILPQLAPFILAQMIFSAPAAILAEAGLSFLGLGDPSLPTWGQILEQGFKTGGIYVGYWWWLIPPGLLIAFTAMTFVLLALGMESVVDPRLRRLK